MNPKVAQEKILSSLTEAQHEFADYAAQAMADMYSVSPSDFKVIRTDETEPAEAASVQLKEGDPGYDGIPHQEAKKTNPAQYAVVYSGIATELEGFDPQTPETAMINSKWAFPVEVYPPDDPEGVASITIPLDI